MSKQSKRLEKISQRLTTYQLRRRPEKDLVLTPENIFEKPIEERGEAYFLGYYSPAGLEYALEKYGFFDELRKKGYKNLELIFNIDNPYKHRMALYTEKKEPNFLLGELVVKRRHLTVSSPFPHVVNERDFEVIYIEWLCMQNLKGNFTKDRPRLPGQKYPGLQMGTFVLELLVIACKRLRTAGLLTIPEFFHNAQMYSPSFKYLNPLYAGKQQAIVRDLLSNYTLSEVSWAIDLKCVYENDSPFDWFVSEQIIPIERDLKEYFNCKEYMKAVKKYTETYRYTLDKNKWKTKLQDLEKYHTC
jgi:hypothetical protein